MVVHIFPYKVFTKGFIDFTREKYPIEEHIFIIYGECPNKDFEVAVDKNVYFTKLPIDIVHKQKFIYIINNAKQIIFNTYNIFVTKLLLKRPLWLRKTYIVFWGFDIYCYRERAVGIKKRIWRAIQYWQIRNARAVCVLADKEKQILDSLIPNIKGAKMRAKYLMTTDKAKLVALINYNKNTNPCKILVGNSASKSNCHAEILSRLSVFADKNILVYCPLSYGDTAYRNQITNLGKRLFGKKFIALTEIMPYEDYYKFTNDCIIGLYNNDRQQAMGNITMMFEQGGKVFMRRDTSMWKMFEKQGYVFYDIDDVGKLDWEKFIDFSKENKINNTRVSVEVNSLDATKEIWDKIYEHAELTN